MKCEEKFYHLRDHKWVLEVLRCGPILASWTFSSFMKHLDLLMLESIHPNYIYPFFDFISPLHRLCGLHKSSRQPKRISIFPHNVRFFALTLYRFHISLIQIYAEISLFFLFISPAVVSSTIGREEKKPLYKLSVTLFLFLLSLLVQTFFVVFLSVSEKC